MLATPFKADPTFGNACSLVFAADNAAAMPYAV